MKLNTKSSITLPREELRLVNDLKKRLRAKTNVEVVRRGLRLLKETTDREALRESYASAARAVQKTNKIEIAELDSLSPEGLADEDED